MSRRRRSLPRWTLAGLLAAGLALGAAPMSRSSISDPPAVQTLPLLAALPAADLDGMEPAVQEQLESRMGTLRPPPSSGNAGELAQAYGELGGLCFLYDLPQVSSVALANARSLDGEDFRWPYLAGVVEQNSGDLDAAADSYRTALRLQENYLAARIRLGETLTELNRLDEARDEFERALVIAPRTAAAERGLGKVAAAESKWQQASEHFFRALDLQPQAAELRYPLAQALRQLGRVDEAKEQLALFGKQEVVMPDRVLLELRGLVRGASVHLMRGRRAQRRGNLDAAVAEFRKAIEADPESANGYGALGAALRLAQQGDGAIAAFRRAAQLEPGRASRFYDLGAAYLDTGNGAGAEEQARQALKLDPELAEGHLLLGLGLSRQGQLEEALAAFDQAATLAPDKSEPRFERAMALLALRRNPAAIEQLDELIARDPQHAAARANLGVLLEVPDPEASQAHLLAALEQGPGKALAARSHLSLGRIAERRQELSVAVDRYHQAIAEDASLAPAHLRLGSVQAQQGKLEEAIASFRTALAENPALIVARLPLASALLGLGDDQGARRALEGLEQPPPVAAHLLGLILSSSPQPEARDARRGLELAQDAFRRTQSPLFGQGVAIALAANGRFEEAVRAQQRLITAMDRQGGAPPEAQARLATFRAGRAVVAPWQDDRRLIPPPWFPLSNSPRIAP
ncbi:MAG: tetratricopeptide repeat protein [Acidobacteriota bacterium]